MWPFGSSVAFKPATDIKPLNGKVILVTGGNNGIGKETVLQLAQHQPSKIYLAARTESKALDAIKSIKAAIEDKDVDIEHLPLDLASLPSVRAAADRVISRSDRLDILILNAGIMNIPGTTETGQDMQMGTNHVGHFLLTRSLLPLLQKTAKQPNADVRVVTVASDAYSLAPKLETMLSTEKLLKTNLYTRYGASKAANILFAAEFASRYPEITTVSLHPGLIKTDLFEPNLGPIMRFGVGLVGPLLYQNIPTGALNQLWAAAGAEKQTLVNGGYYTPIGQAKKNKWSTDPAASKKFWEWTENELKAAGY